MPYPKSPENLPEKGINLTIEKLKKGSPFARSKEKGGECFIEDRAEKRFKIELIKSPEQPEVREIQKILEKTFSRAEVDPIEVLKLAMGGETLSGEKDNYKVYVLKNEKGRIVSLLMGGPMDLLDKDGRDLNEVVFLCSYTATEKRVRQKGLARELYISAIIDAQKEAENSGREFKAFAGECTSKSESFWNKVGLKRAYIKKVKDLLEEVQYVAPPTEWDEETGRPPKNAGDSPEHLMFAIFDSTTERDNREEIAQIANAFYRWGYKGDRSEFSNEAAFQLNNGHVDDLEKKLKNQLSQGGETLVLMTRQERLAAIESGVRIIEHTAADKVVNAAGKEDL